jgi:hypothetical protein
MIRRKASAEVTPVQQSMTHEDEIQEGLEQSVPLSIEDPSANNESEMNRTPLDERILELVARNPVKVYASRLVTELGLSYEDASSELCGLLSAVGGGSCFRFEALDPSTPQHLVMRFSFPPDFAARARRSRAKYEWEDTLRRVLSLSVKVLKIITAFGLILSLLIVTIAALVGILAALVALSRSGNDNHRHQLLRRMRHMFFTMRQLLWCYAMFGQHFEGQDPYLSEIAYDLALCSSVCCGNPGSIWFWWRADQLSRRRRYMGRRWGRLLEQQERRFENQRQEERLSDRQERITRSEFSEESSEDYRGLLSLAIEFLFGPVPFSPGPSELEKWKLRAAVLLEKNAQQGSVSLRDMSPYMDKPPDSLEDDEKIQAGGLAIVTHFHGIPMQKDDGGERFTFPELLAESSHSTLYEEVPNSDNGTWQALFYVPDLVVWFPLGRLPTSLQERRYRLTLLGSKQFLQCVAVGTLNFVGVWWLALSLEPGGSLRDFIGNPVATAVLRGTIIRVLKFYSVLFFALPIGRLVLICALNAVCEGHNRKRADLAHSLMSHSQGEVIRQN